MSTEIKPFRLSVPQAELDDLRERLVQTRWPDPETVADTSQGPQLEKIRALIDYWRDAYDWRRCETELNELGQYRTLIDGLRLHFLHVRSPEPNALPLLMTHGWPGSVLEFRKVIGPLTDPVAHGGEARDAFHLVLPTLPGFGFSDKPTETGWGIGRIAQAWVTLMERLGYHRWVAQGGDWGSAVTTAIGQMRPVGCVGIHLNFAMCQPTPQEQAEATPEELDMMAGMARYQRTLSGYAHLQGTRPQSIGFGLADSPVGQAAWIYALLQDVSDSAGDAESVFTRDEMLDDIMLYWLPNTGASSARLYWEAMSSLGGGDDVLQIPTGLSMFRGEIGRISYKWAKARYANLIHYNSIDRGGHFAALEEPAIFAQELRTAFAKLRRG